MPTELQIAVGVVAILSFVVSTILGWIKVQEWRARPDLRLDMDWIVGGGGPSTLRIVAENGGKGRGGIRNIVLSPGDHHDPATGFAFLPHFDELPVMLNPGEFARFSIELDPNKASTFTDALLNGRLTHAILIDQDRTKRAFPIPAQPAQQADRMSLVGRVVKR